MTSALPAPAWFERITKELDAADTRATSLANGLTVAQLNWKPSPKAWSVGQCLEHLCLSNEVYVAPIEAALRAPPTGAEDEITPGWFGSWFIRTYIDPNTQKTRARSPRSATPAMSHVDASILQRFIDSNNALRHLASRARGHDVNRLRFRNPFVSWIRFTVGTGFQIVARHNHRHLGQAERVTCLPGFPRA